MSKHAFYANARVPFKRLRFEKTSASRNSPTKAALTRLVFAMRDRDADLDKCQREYLALVRAHEEHQLNKRSQSGHKSSENYHLHRIARDVMGRDGWDRTRNKVQAKW